MLIQEILYAQEYFQRRNRQNSLIKLQISKGSRFTIFTHAPRSRFSKADIYGLVYASNICVHLDNQIRISIELQNISNEYPNNRLVLGRNLFLTDLAPTTTNPKLFMNFTRIASAISEQLCRAL